MSDTEKIAVALDKPLVEALLTGLHLGAQKKALKVVLDAYGSYHVESREMRILIVPDTSGKIKHIHVHDEKLSAEIKAEDIQNMGLTPLASEVMDDLKKQYDPSKNSLSTNIIVFSRTYNG